MKRLLSNISQRMGSSSPDVVLSNTIEIMKSANPHIKFAIAFLTPWALLATAVLRYEWAAGWLRAIKDYFVSSIFASVTIPSTHPLNKSVLAYMVEHGLGRNARALALTPPGLSAMGWQELDRVLHPAMYDPYGRRSAAHNRHKVNDDPNKRDLSYVPEVGTYHFWYKFHRMTFERKTVALEHVDYKGRRAQYAQPTGTEETKISCFSPFSGAKPIQDFLQHIKAAPAKDRSTTIYRPDVVNMTWDQGISRPSRNLNAVTLDSNIKDDLVKDVETYLSPATRKYYANRGIPYRRGLLFYGNPGCGKTSFTNALAGHFDLNVYMVSLSTTSFNDSILELLFEQLPSKCIVLLEDIDSAGLRREDMRAQPAKKKRKSRHQPTVPLPTQLYNAYGEAVVDDEEVLDTGGVTLSGLLNVLDGIHSKEGAYAGPALETLSLRQHSC